ncbi:MAG TPA: phospholipase D-like domain-containing protein [Thermoanaerobaculia bacterium]|nr:phospholipase D-like domain-containing protein [Thermoanaerobaculia bacterium]
MSLFDAVKRGVDVRVMIPSADVTDSPIVQHASHHHYGTLLKGGVKLFDYQRTLLHQKVVVIDSAWACVGSTNFDDRSFELNDEISLVIHDRNIARELEEIFEADLKHAVAVDFDEWQHRAWAHKQRRGGGRDVRPPCHAGEDSPASPSLPVHEQHQRMRLRLRSGENQKAFAVARDVEAAVQRRVFLRSVEGLRAR